MGATVKKKEKSVFFNHSFDKKRLKALISWVFKQSGEAEAVRVVDLLKETGFRHATKAGISIGLHDLTTPIQKSWLISESQLAMNTTERDFVGARITATERSQRIIDTWHRASESLSKQVVDYFGIYDRFNPVYIMALSGARGNFSQVRQLIGMRGLMADQQGKIVSFPIRSNLREGLTLTEYFISCSGARKGLVDTALRTADTGYLTRRLVDVSHHVVVKRIRCNTNRGIAFKSLQSYNKVLLPLKERLVGRVLAEDIFASSFVQTEGLDGLQSRALHDEDAARQEAFSRSPKRSLAPLLHCKRAKHLKEGERLSLGSPSYKSLPLQILAAKPFTEGDPVPSPTVKGKDLYGAGFWITSGPFRATFTGGDKLPEGAGSPSVKGFAAKICTKGQKAIAKKDQAISLKLSSEIDKIREEVYLRSPLTCGFTHTVCQLCYGWSISQGSLVSLGDAVGVIAAQSIGEPGTQLTMRTFHTGGVFSGDLLQEIRAPHTGKILYSKAFQGLLIRTAHGRIAFLSKTEGSLILSDDSSSKRERETSQKGVSLPTKKSACFTTIPIPAFTMLFVRQGERVENNQLLAEFSIRRKEGNQPIKTEQTIFAELSGKVVEDCSGKLCTREVKESAVFLDSLQNHSSYWTYRAKMENSQDIPHNSARKQNVSDLSPYTRGDLYSFSSYNGYISAKKQKKKSHFAYKSEICKGCTAFANAPIYKERHTCPSSLVQISGLYASQNKALPSPSYKSFLAYKYKYKSKPFTVGDGAGSWITSGPFRATFTEGDKVILPLRASICTKGFAAKICTCKGTELRTSTNLRPKGQAASPFLAAKPPAPPGNEGDPRFINRFVCKALHDKICTKVQDRDLYGGLVRRVGRKTKANPRSFMAFLSYKHKILYMLRLQSSYKYVQISNLYAQLCTKGKVALPMRRSKNPVRRAARKALYGQRAVGEKSNVQTSLKKRENVRRASLQKQSFEEKKGVQDLPLQKKLDPNPSLTGTPGKRFLFLKERQESPSSVYKVQILSSYKNEDLEGDVFKYIEPVKSGRLGFLKILATRVGATLDYTCPIKSFDTLFVKRKSYKSFCTYKALHTAPAHGSSLAQIETLYGQGSVDKAVPQRRDENETVQTNNSLFSSFAANYLHPEFVKENRFLLQTVGEYGDIVDESYKKEIL